MATRDGGLMKLGGVLAGRSLDDPAATGAFVRQWANGDAVLKDIKGYTDEDMYHMAQQGYTLYLNGKFKDAQTVFEGLVAVDPRNEYYYRALGVVYHRRGDAEKAIKQFDHAIKVAPRAVAAYVNRAEVHISRREFDRAIADLELGIRVARDPTAAIVRKAAALRTLLLRGPRR